MADEMAHPRELSTARENHLTVRFDARSGSASVLSDLASEQAFLESLRENLRTAQERSGVRLMSSSTA